MKYYLNFCIKKNSRDISKGKILRGLSYLKNKIKQNINTSTNARQRLQKIIKQLQAINFNAKQKYLFLLIFRLHVNRLVFNYLDKSKVWQRYAKLPQMLIFMNSCLISRYKEHDISLQQGSVITQRNRI